jgi:protein-tyrosine-phosphatase
VRSADLIVTAEPHHVVWIAGRWPEAFSKTYTLPELVTYGEDVGSRGNETLSTWLTRAANVRPPTRAYLEPNTVAAVPDPTGAPEEKWIRVADQIDDLCGRLALLLA